MEIIHHFIEIQGLRTHYMQAGAGGSEEPGQPTVILLHGGGIDSARLSWDPIIPELAASCRVVAPDWPGFGESARLERACTVDFLAGFLADFLDALGIGRASLAGLSMGGSAALGFTLRFPGRVERLVLAGSYGLQRKVAYHFLSYLFIRLPGLNALSYKLVRSRPAARWLLKSLLRRPGAITEELLDQIEEEMRRPGAGAAFQSFQRDEMTPTGTRTCFLDRLGEIAAPVLIVHGALDGSVPQEAAREAHVRIPGSRLYWMEGCGHWVQRDDPKTFNRVVRQFLCEEG
jgi:pimeloyl-ACP methyl ester carboxylesterase